MPDTTDDLLTYLDASPTPFHAVKEATYRLEAHGFRVLDEATAFDLAPGDRRYVVRGETSVVAFRVGQKPMTEAGVRMIGAHTDSPNLRLKPSPDLAAAGCHQLAVEPYGGVLLHTWLDRDLGLAGRVVVSRDGALASCHVDLRTPLLRIPSLAIHLQRGVNTDGLVVNAQRHLPPLAALAAGGPFDVKSYLGGQLGVPAEAVVAFDLMLTDLQPAARLGARGELVSSGRLDNLASCHAALVALCAAAEAGPADATQLVALFDHEEVGSRSAQGAAGSFLRDVIARVLGATGETRVDALPRAMARSFLVSADMAHALHPNHTDRHEPGHAPILGLGPVIKSNVNQSYATDAATLARFVRVAEEASVPTQRFVTRSDLGCGSTIGPITAAALGVPTVDVGLPMLSMHSCRELAAAADVPAMVAVLTRLLVA